MKIQWLWGKGKDYGQVRNYYEIVVIYNEDYGEVIVFCTDEIMNDSNDIVSQAIELELLEERYRDKVRWAMAISDYEYEYIK